VNAAPGTVTAAFHCLGAFRVGKLHAVYDSLPEIAAMENFT